MDKISFFFLNVFLNSLLSFFTVVLLIEGIIFLFRVPQGRIAAALRIIPIFKLPLDLCLYDFSKWSYAHGINPLNCEKGTRIFSVVVGGIREVTDWLILPISSRIQFTVLEQMTFTVADILGYSIKPEFLNASVLLFMMISGALLCIKFIKYYQSIRSLNSLTKIAQPISRKTRNLTLNFHLKKYRLQILTSPNPNLGGSPFVTGLTSYSVYIPKQLSQTLSREEYEAVLAHEIEHIRHKDSLVRLLLELIESIFWWTPTKWLHKRIEEGQETGCDLNCQKYGVQPTDLASAICKSARHSTNKPVPFFTHHLTKNTVFKRVSALLGPATPFKKIRYACSILAIGIAFSMIFLGRFWIF